VALTALLSGSLLRVLDAEEIFPRSSGQKGEYMLYTIALVMIVLWLLGLVSSYTMGGLIHILLVVAVVMVLLRLIQGRRPV
jgi:hypothetical protein